MTQNVKGKLSFHIKRQTRRLDNTRNQPKMPAKPCRLGDTNSVLDVYNGEALPDGYVVVRDDDGNLSVAFNSRVTNVANLAVYVGYDPVLEPTLYQVLGQRDIYPTQQAPYGLPLHHKTHEYPHSDTVSIHSEQFLPALVTANSGMVLTIFPSFCPVSTGGWVYIHGTGAGNVYLLDLAATRPTAGAQAFAICARDDGTISVVAGGTVTTPELLTAAQFPAMPDATYHPLCAVRLYSGQSTIRQGTLSPDLYDLRAWLGGGSGSSGYTPPATTAANDFQVGDGSGHWIKNTLAQVVTTLRTLLDSAYLKLTGGTLTGTLTVNPSSIPDATTAMRGVTSVVHPVSLVSNIVRSFYGYLSSVILNNPSASSLSNTSAYGASFSVTQSQSIPTNNLFGVLSGVQSFASTINAIIGILGSAYNSSGLVVNLYGAYYTVLVSRIGAGSAAATNAYGKKILLMAEGISGGDAQITNGYGAFISVGAQTASGGTAGVANAYGMYLADFVSETGYTKQLISNITQLFIERPTNGVSSNYSIVSNGISWFLSGLSTDVPVTIKGFAGQTAHLTEWQDSTGAVLSYIDANGNFSGDAAIVVIDGVAGAGAYTPINYIPKNTVPLYYMLISSGFDYYVLPIAATGSGKKYTIKNIGAVTVTVAPLCSDTIDGAADQPVAYMQAMRLYDYSAGVWYII
jgi:hypothetical protein